MDDLHLRQELETHHPQCYGWALCCCQHNRDLAEDVLQRTYLKILSGSARFDGYGLFTTWLFAVIRLTALDERRRHWLRTFRLLAYRPPTPAPSEPPESLPHETLSQFRKALESLAPRQRELLHLVFYQDLSLAEAAKVMQISLGSARQHYQRGKTKIRHSLGHLKEFQELESHVQTSAQTSERSATPGTVL